MIKTWFDIEGDKMKVRKNGEIYETALNGVWMPDGGFWPTPPLVPMTEPADLIPSSMKQMMNSVVQMLYAKQNDS